MNLPHTLSDHRRSSHGLRPLTIVRYIAIFVAAILLATIFLPASTANANEFTPGEGGSHSCGTPGFPSCSSIQAAHNFLSNQNQLEIKKQKCQGYINSDPTNYKWSSNKCWKRVGWGQWTEQHV